jgi:hypothetical protein
MNLPTIDVTLTHSFEHAGQRVEVPANVSSRGEGAVHAWMRTHVFAEHRQRFTQLEADSVANERAFAQARAEAERTAARAADAKTSAEIDALGASVGEPRRCRPNHTYLMAIKDLIS